MKTIELTDEQYEILVRLSFIGEWVLNAQHVTPEFKAEQECLNYLYSNCEKFNLRKQFVEIGDAWEMEEAKVFEIIPVIEEFSNNDFWPNLISLLSERDAVEQLYNGQKENIHEEEFEEFIEERKEKYFNEFEQNSILNLRLRNVKDN